MWMPADAPIADVFVVWADARAHHDGCARLTPRKGREGFSGTKIEGKLWLRASVHDEDRDGGRRRTQRRSLPNIAAFEKGIFAA